MIHNICEKIFCKKSLRNYKIPHVLWFYNITAYLSYNLRQIQSPKLRIADWTKSRNSVTEIVMYYQQNPFELL
jgi:hypothetical protein